MITHRIMQLNDLKLPFFLWRIKNGKHLHFVYAQSHISDSFIFTREPLNCRGRHHDQLSEFENKRIIGMMKIRFSVLPIKAFLKQIFDRMHQREVTNTTVRLRAFSKKKKKTNISCHMTYKDDDCTIIDYQDTDCTFTTGSLLL